MNVMKIAIIVLISSSLLACGGAHRKASRAQAKTHQATEAVAKERLRLIDEYRVCVDDAGDDAIKVEACDSYLKAAEALK